MSKERIKWIEYAQIISMLLVVFHHSNPNYTEINVYLDRFAESVHYPALAVFFAISGFLSLTWKKKGYSIWIRDRFVRLLIPWIVLSAVMLVPKFLLASQELRMEMLTVRNLGMGIINPHIFGILPHLWFLPTLFILSLFICIIDMISNTKWICVCLLIFSLSVSILPNTLTSVLCLNELRMYSFWFILGYVIGSKSNIGHIARTPKIVIICMLVTVGFCLTIMFLNYRSLLTIIGFISVVLLSICMKRFVLFDKLFSGKTYTIYLLSLCVQNFIEVLAGKARLNGNLTVSVMFLAGVFVPILIYLVASFLFSSNGKISKSIRVILGM